MLDTFEQLLMGPAFRANTSAAHLRNKYARSSHGNSSLSLHPDWWAREALQAFQAEARIATELNVTQVDMCSALRTVHDGRCGSFVRRATGSLFAGVPPSGADVLRTNRFFSLDRHRDAYMRSHKAR